MDLNFRLRDTTPEQLADLAELTKDFTPRKDWQVIKGIVTDKYRETGSILETLKAAVFHEYYLYRLVTINRLAKAYQRCPSGPVSDLVRNSALGRTVELLAERYDHS
ncbi:hypothetical protein KY366_04145 [Candidatus Woesearchaeota archaeon]|nr:hypothetical protein [Candidatus Woesearchaeota archaeon]